MSRMRERADSMEKIDNSDVESVVTSRSDLQQKHGKNEPPRAAQFEPPGDPLFLQYPIGDGCHVVVAMYVERDPATALRRFPTLQRTRLMSAHKAKTMDQMAAIFKEALEDEKDSCMD
ncbi:hypothetical protein BGZ65_006045 [Modicella reniformis]|uniref:Uncharacterized protein n=1 Tax=Modicella reniformis TaxID=1440133 RepID=A0A9P6M8F6_9FUNG|nr:hypothetical protein BGZ65_006045 [Modicella reniformis]